MTPLAISVFLSVLAATLCTALPRLRGFAFSAWIVFAFAAAMQYPSAFGTWGTFNLAVLIVPLIQIIMFGMGTTLTVEDFARAFRNPKPVLIGIGAQFLIMPIVGWLLASAMKLEPEVMVGVILIGSVSGGVASNLMVFLAGGNVALSVTMTACSTLISPLMTPLLMKLLAGAIVPISFIGMMLSILNMIIAPILAGLIAHEILYGNRSWNRKPLTLIAIAFTTSLLSVVIALTDLSSLGKIAVIRPGLIVGLVLIALIALVKLIVTRRALDDRDWIGRILPFVSMVGIWIVITIITARSRDTLIAVGGVLIIVAIIHNAIGYMLGYWSGRAARLDEKTCRTIAFEVGMQNGGMAAGLAMDALKSSAAALAPAIFGPWMNISGSILASWWKKHPAETDDGTCDNQ